MALVVAFALGMLLGIALGVGATLVVDWTRERLDRQRSYAAYAEELRLATDSLRLLFTQEIGNRSQAFGHISQQLQVTERHSQELLRVSTALNHALSHPVVRGQWGERMVEDVLKPVGFQEGINYVKQTTTAAGNGRPDYTFLLPRGLQVNLDAKFPLDNYLAYCRAEGERAQQDYRKRFIQDVRRRLKQVAGKDYIDPAANTVDFALLFIPNEQIYSFVNVSDATLFDDALRSKVVLCSPWTLYPILAILRLAIDNFVLEKTTAALVPLLAGFDKQWQAFQECLDKMGRRLAEAQKEFDQLVTTRQRQLQRVLTEIDTLRRSTDFHRLGDSSGPAGRRSPTSATPSAAG
jgi:DNA recombination protein RmuC